MESVSKLIEVVEKYSILELIQVICLEVTEGYTIYLYSSSDGDDVSFPFKL